MAAPLKAFAAALALLACLLHVPSSSAAAPELLRNPYYESPVSAGPDELVFLGGLGFKPNDRVVYEAMRKRADAATHPDAVPEQNTNELGAATIVKLADPAYSVTFRLPEEVSANVPYRLWVVTAANEWSKPFYLNDARPVWFSPGYVHATEDVAGLGRKIRIIGRNLLSGTSKLRLAGESHTYILTPSGLPGDGGAQDALRHYVLEATLPAKIEPGTYKVSLTSASGWIDVPDQRLMVLPDPPPPAHFSVDDPRFGKCRPNDKSDDSSCFGAAIEAAHAAGGGVVMVPPGTWDLYPLKQPDHRDTELTLGQNISLQGAGADKAVIVRHDSPDAPAHSPLLLLEGNNSISGLQFNDERSFDSFERARPVIQLGAGRAGPHPQDKQPPAVVRRIAITANRFRKVGIAVESGGLPLEQLFITHNDFGGYARDLEMPGSRWSVRNPFRIDDAVIRWNRFVPGSYVDEKAQQGVIATGLGASRRVDFSSNEADGASIEGLSAAADAPGWRAGFFWNMSNNHESLLVADNRISCPGDKAGDGEAIALDANGDTEAYHGAQTVAAAAATSLSLRGEPLWQQSERPVDKDTYYNGYWIQVVDGPGIGQTRRIESYRWDQPTSNLQLRVSPAWDIPPQPGASRVILTRQYWQAYIVSNQIDQSKPTCKKANLNNPRGGLIVVGGPAIDSAVEHNQQHDTGGILVGHAYNVQAPSCPKCGDQAVFQTALEVRNNVIDGEYDWTSDCSDSGLRATYGASPTPESPPPTLSFGVQFSHNVVTHADGLHGGALNIVPTWFRGPEPQHWRILENLILSHNTIRDVEGAPPSASCKRGQRERSGIRIEGTGNVHDTILYKNNCERVGTPLQDAGEATLRMCPATGAGSCECPAALPK